MYHITRHVARRVCLIVRERTPVPAGVTAGAEAFLASEQGRIFYWAPVMLGFGIALYFSVRFEPPLMLVVFLAGLAVVATGIAIRSDTRWLGIAAACILAGFSLAAVRTIWVAAPVLPAKIGPAPLQGQVLNVETRDQGFRLLLAPRSFAGLKAEDLPARVRVTVRTRGEKPLAGQLIAVRSILRPPPAPVEPGAFDFQRHLFFQGIGGVGFAVGPVVVIRTDGGGASVARIRNDVSDRINRALPGQTGALAAALLVGDRGRVDQGSLRALRDSGLAHLLAISGLHVGLVAGFIFFALRSGLACWPTVAVSHPIKKYAAIAAALGAGAYLVLAGGSIPTQRAFVVVLIGMLAVLLDRRAISLRVVALAALVVLILSPDALTGASFQMSFAAVLGLVAAYEVFSNRLGPWIHGGPVRRVWLYLAGVLITTLIASLATAPFAIHHFNRVADYGVVANLAAMPVMAFWVMPWGVVSMIALPAGLEHWPLVAMGWGIDAILSVATMVSGWSGAVRLVPTGPDWAFYLTVAGGLWLALIRHHWRLAGVLAIGIGMAGPMLADRPDIRVSAGGDLTGVRSANGGLVLSSGRLQKFVAAQWLRRDGLGMRRDGPGMRQDGLGQGKVAWPENGATPDGRLRCDFGGCVWRRDGVIIALPSTPGALIDDCMVADAVVTTIPAGRLCRGRNIPVVDFFDLWADGAVSVYVDGDRQVSVQSVNGVRGRRPWVWRPTPRRDHYWR